jgi:hypothetical protein
MALTQDDLDELDFAIASGELTVKINGREITYRSVSELQQARRHVVSLLRGKSRSALGARIVTQVDRGL